MPSAPAPPTPPPAPSRAWILRAVGAGLLVATYAPLHRLLTPARTGLAGAATRASAEAAWSQALWGTLLVAGLATAAALVTPWDPGAWAARAARRLARVPAAAFAGAVAAVGFVLAATAALALFGGGPRTVDEMVQLLHARAVLAGAPALPVPGEPAAWMVQNSLLTPQGWASVYPPLHTLLLAAGAALGAPWLLGPLATGAASGLAFLAFHRLLPGRPGLARAAGAAAAVAPFTVLLGGTHLSHAPAAAFAALTLWALLKARDGSAAWGLAVGAGVGAFVCTRPWTGIALSAAMAVAVWGPDALRRGRGWWGSRTLAVAAGGAPFALLLLGWNRVLFGSPFRLGYTAAYGPAHGLGFHTDPWGNAYGVREAMAYTASDLTHLGVTLLETPIPALAMVGAGLLLVPRLAGGATPLLAWATAGVLANAAYWHHGIHLGPRMLYETAPAWAALWVTAAAAVWAPSSALPPRLRRAVAWGVAFSLAGATFLAPARALGYRGDDPPPPPLSGPGTPALVFAHGSWASRVAARLAGGGMRRDSVETALRRNDLCAVDAYARWRLSGGEGEAPSLDLRPAPGSAPHLRPVLLSPGNAALLAPGAPLAEGCRREARSDRLGTAELEPLLWRWPPVPGAGTVVAHDLGPVGNRAVLRAFEGLTPWVLVAGGADGTWRLLPYQAGMDLLWGSGEGAAVP